MSKNQPQRGLAGRSEWRPPLGSLCQWSSKKGSWLIFGGFFVLDYFDEGLSRGKKLQQVAVHLVRLN
jgi:hypothetical protein